ncbi:hypothetical protein [Atlantibacter hermannii]|uniref:hypothetical protein n=1 Tax=Atlantibacter hermannii TaxID=565 RepID=UPI0028AC0E9A|nr:hypothetical protein [Atlantibacter hermannii]
MHTQNVKTAAPESSERWGEKPYLRTDGFIRNLNSSNVFDVIRADVVLTRMEDRAHMGCGLFCEIYEFRLLEQAMLYLERLPVKDRQVFMETAARRGYELTQAEEKRTQDAYNDFMFERAKDY